MQLKKYKSICSKFKTDKKNIVHFSWISSFEIRWSWNTNLKFLFEKQTSNRKIKDSKKIQTEFAFDGWAIIFDGILSLRDYQSMIFSNFMKLPIYKRPKGRWIY